MEHVFEEGDLNETAVVRKFRTTAPDGKNYNVAFYNSTQVNKYYSKTKNSPKPMIYFCRG